MVDIIRTVKSIMDAHGAWIFGGAVLGAITAHVHKKRSFDADWFHVTCYGCGRAGFSDEFAGVTTPDGRLAYQCVRCQRPDLFRQAEDVDYSTIVYRVRVRDVDGESGDENYHYRTKKRAMEHVNNVIAAYDWYGFEEVPVAGERRRWKTTSGEDWEIMMTPIRLGNIVREADDYGVGAVWMADSYDPAIHGNTIPTGSVKRFLDKIPMGQMFHVDFVKSNGDLREMDAFFNKPFDTDSMVANVMERTGTGAVFKRFRVDRVVGLYRI